MADKATPNYWDKLITNEGYDFAVVQFKNRPPMAIERAVCKCSKEGECITLSVSNGPHPIHEKKTASALHYLPLSEMTGITYYTENRISTIKPIAEA